MLSDAQLESIIYAGEAHGGYLADSWTVDDTFDVVSAAPDDAEKVARFRRGRFPGTGAGKGRQVAGILLDNWLKCCRRALWIPKSDKLIEDAQRDRSALGHERLLITPLSRFRQSTPIRLDEGILFTTYATRRSDAREERVSRVRQIVDWLGRDFDGLIIFDESHAMQNATDAKGERGEQAPSQQGRAGLRLQHALPNARVLYVSATGATTVHNLAYAQRLGLWGGVDFPFATQAEFVEAVEAGGVAAMEVLARDLKALGLYAARSLSYDGIEYELVEHLDAGAFQVIHNNLDAVLQAANVTRDSRTLIAKAKSAARSAFESAKQRFFNHLITAMKTPALIAAHSMRVYHLQTDEGERIIGRLVSPASVAQAVESEAPALDPAEAFAAVLDGRTILHLQDELEVRRVKVMGDLRIKVSDFTDGMVDRLKVTGLVSEIIAWRLRLLVPLGTDGPAILGALMEGYPLVRVAERPTA